MATTHSPNDLTRLNPTHIILTPTGIAFSLLPAVTAFLIPTELASPLILGTAITLYLLTNNLFAIS